MTRLPEGSVLALIGSRGLLEMSVNCGNARQQLNAQKYDGCAGSPRPDVRIEWGRRWHSTTIREERLIMAKHEKSVAAFAGGRRRANHSVQARQGNGADIDYSCWYSWACSAPDWRGNLTAEKVRHRRSADRLADADRQMAHFKSEHELIAAELVLAEARMEKAGLLIPRRRNGRRSRRRRRPSMQTRPEVRKKRQR
jgi:hypothetical protein